MKVEHRIKKEDEPLANGDVKEEAEEKERDVDEAVGEAEQAKSGVKREETSGEEEAADRKGQQLTNGEVEKPDNEGKDGDSSDLKVVKSALETDQKKVNSGDDTQCREGDDKDDEDKEEEEETVDADKTITPDNIKITLNLKAVQNLDSRKRPSKGYTLSIYIYIYIYLMCICNLLRFSLSVI